MADLTTKMRLFSSALETMLNYSAQLSDQIRNKRLWRRLGKGRRGLPKEDNLSLMRMTVGIEGLYERCKEEKSCLEESACGAERVVIDCAY